MARIGDGVVVENGGRLQQRAAKRNEWNATKRARFLDHLAATCNVVQSAAAAGMSANAAHMLRRRDAGFGEQWTLALEAGYQHLEAKLLAHALGADAAVQAVGPDGHIPGSDPGIVAVPFDPATAMAVLQQFRAAGSDPAARRRTTHAVKQATIEEVRASLMQKLGALAKRRKAGMA